MANFAFALKRALLHPRREIGKRDFHLGTNYSRLPHLSDSYGSVVNQEQCPARAGHIWSHRTAGRIAFCQGRTRSVPSAYRVPPSPRPFGIIELQAKTTKIFKFKGLIWKIFRNKDLAGYFIPRPRRAGATAKNKIGCGRTPHPNSYSLLLLYQFEPPIRTAFPALFPQRIHQVIEKIVKGGA